MPPTRSTRNRAAQDTTLINLRALKGRVTQLEREDRSLQRLIRHLARRVARLELNK